MTVTNTSFFIVGPNDNLQDKINHLKTEAESSNQNSEVSINIISETTEGCSVGNTQYFYRMEIKEK